MKIFLEYPRGQPCSEQTVVREGEVNLSLDRPAPFTVDINGQMEDQDSWRLPNSWPGGPTEGPWLTLYFLPGLHEVGLDFLTSRSYHITGEAVAFGSLSKDSLDVDDGENIHIYDQGF